MGGAISGLVYQPPRPPTYSEQGSRDLQLRWVSSRLAPIPVVWVPARRNPEDALTILYSHGNAEDVGIAAHWARAMSRRHNINVLVYDYTGYGHSKHPPSEEDTYADIASVHSYLLNDLEIAPGKIVLYGRSLGSGPTCELASTRQGQYLGVVLHSPLSSVFRVGVHTPFTLFGDMYCNTNKIGSVTAPVFIMHGRADEVVPFKHGAELARKLQYDYPPWWVDEGHHNDLEVHWEETYHERFAEFLDHLRSLDAAAVLHPPEKKKKRSSTSSSSMLSSSCSPADRS